ncbi:hypothetical protein EI555_013207 [Monodon monoceros]|uniref:Nucleophosmin n=1 Tax=Monodon monoceros TaxID=40151 RepID=A0A4V5P7R8_MONMO|nr:hypothetical protein EI555_013207 [Monodon monoceros]
MEDSMDMDMSPLRSQNYLFVCELKADKDYHFKVDNDENEHQLSLRTLSLGAGAKDELHIVGAEAMNYEGSPIQVTLATSKMSVQPMVSLGGFEITPPVCSAPGSGSKFPRKKVKLAADEDDDDDADDDDDDFDDEEAEEKAPVICTRYASQKCTKIKPEWKGLKTINTKIKRSRILQKTGKDC